MGSTLKTDYSKISPTAKITAYWKSLSDIPYAKEIADAVYAQQVTKEMLGDKITLMAHFSPPILEARFKAINIGIRESRAENILELACGLSPRGLTLAASGKKYVGADLPELLAESAEVINSIAERLKIPGENLHFQSANVLNKEQLEEAIDYFKGEKFVVCNEGLLMYLNHKEKAIMAQHLRDLLLKSGSTWVTTDIVFTYIRKKLLSELKPEVKEKLKSLIGIISNKVERDFTGNDFETEIDAIEFYEDLGFTIEKFPFYDSNYKISTLSRLSDEMREPVLKVLSTSIAWRLIPRA